MTRTEAPVPTGITLAERAGGGLLMQCNREGCRWHVSYLYHPVFLTELAAEAGEHLQGTHRTAATPEEPTP